MFYRGFLISYILEMTFFFHSIEQREPIPIPIFIKVCDKKVRKSGGSGMQTRSKTSFIPIDGRLPLCSLHLPPFHLFSHRSMHREKRERGCESASLLEHTLSRGVPGIRREALVTLKACVGVPRNILIYFINFFCVSGIIMIL